MIVQQIVCDNCGATKKETNNWFELHVIYEIGIFSNHILPNSILLSSENKVHKLDLCGQECMIDTISKLLSNIGHK